MWCWLCICSSVRWQLTRAQGPQICVHFLIIFPGKELIHVAKNYSKIPPFPSCIPAPSTHLQSFWGGYRATSVARWLCACTSSSFFVPAEQVRTFKQLQQEKGHDWEIYPAQEGEQIVSVHAFGWNFTANRTAKSQELSQPKCGVFQKWELILLAQSKGFGFKKSSHSFKNIRPHFHLQTFRIENHS